MNHGDVVIYRYAHFAWLMQASAWVSKYIQRREYVGKVVAVKVFVGHGNPTELVTVRWLTDGRQTVHFAENLEVLEG